MSALVEAIPLVVLGGAGLVMFGMVAATGARILTSVDFKNNRYNLFVVAISVGFGMIPLVAPNFFKHLPHGLHPLLESGILLAAIVAVALNFFFNGVTSAEKAREEAVGRRGHRRTRLTSQPQHSGNSIMALISNTYGKGRVRVMRIKKDGPMQEVRELSVKAMLTGDFAAAFTDHDNSKAVSTDTVKNVDQHRRARKSRARDRGIRQGGRGALPRALSAGRIRQHRSARGEMEADAGRRPAACRTASCSTITVSPTSRSTATRAETKVVSGITGFTFMKSTESGWDHYYKDDYTTIAETRDRMCATAMAASWRWSRAPNDYTEANVKILSTMLEVFATTYSESVQDSLYRMGSAALAAVPEVDRHQPCLSEQALSADQPAAVRSQQRECGVRADRRAAWPDRMRDRAGVIATRSGAKATCRPHGSRSMP